MSSNIVTGNVTSYLQSVFHPEWFFDPSLGFLFRLDTSLMGDVTVGEPTNTKTIQLTDGSNISFYNVDHSMGAGMNYSSNGNLYVYNNDPQLSIWLNDVVEVTSSNLNIWSNTNVSGNVAIGSNGTNYTFTLNGQTIAASGQGVASLNGAQGALALFSPTNTISIGVVGTQINIDFSGTTGGTAGVTSISGLTGNIGLSAGPGIHIIANTTTSEITISNTGVLTICGNLSGNVGIVAADPTVTIGRDGNNNITISAAAGGGNASTWANYYAISNIDVSGYSIYDSSADRAITLSGNTIVNEGLTVMGNIVSACGNLAIATGNLLMSSGNVNATAGVFSQGLAVGGNASITGNLTVSGQAYVNTLPIYDTTIFYSNVPGAAIIQTICDILIDTSHVYRFSVGNWISPNVTLSRYSLFLSLSAHSLGYPEFPIVDRYNLVTGPSLDSATISGYYTEYSTVFTCFTSYSNVQLNAILGISDPTTYMAFGNIAIERLR